MYSLRSRASGRLMDNKKPKMDLPGSGTDAKKPCKTPRANSINVKQRVRVPEREPEDFCCKIKQVFSPPPLSCINGCVIGPYASYRTTEEYTLCEKCFTEKKSGTDVKVTDSLTLKVTDFKKMSNNEEIDEPVVKCRGCLKEFHNVCELHHESVWIDFLCDACHKHRNTVRNNPHRAKGLAGTRLSDHIEGKLNQFLIQNAVQKCKVHVKVLLSEDCAVVLKPNLASNCPNPDVTYPYRNKFIFAFEEIEGVDVAFFAFIVQEYYANCPLPNKGSVYLAYLDSVQLFQPVELRTRVYQTIILSYFEYVKQLGFHSAYIWSCPPSRSSSDYIFYSHPLEMKIPNHARLQAWYKKLLRAGQDQGILLGYHNMVAEAAELQISDVMEMPYFDGDHWPTFLEEAIELVKNDPATVIHSTTTPRKKGKGSKNKKRRIEDVYPNSIRLDGLMSRVVSEMYVHNDTFLVAKLNERDKDSNLPVTDPDPLRPCRMLEVTETNNALLGSRDMLLHVMRQNNYEFNTLRKAKYSTIGLLWGIDKAEILACNYCAQPVGNTGFACSFCKDFDVCVNCKEGGARPVHRHPLVPNADPESQNYGHLRVETLTYEEETHVLRMLQNAAFCRNKIEPSKFSLHGQKLLDHVLNCSEPEESCTCCKEIYDISVFHYTTCRREEDGCDLFICQDKKME